MSTLPFYLRDLPQNWFWRYRTVALIFKIWQTVGKSFAVKCNVYCKHLQQMEKNYNIIFLGIWSSLQSSQEWDSMLCFLFSIFSNLYTIPSTQCSWLLRCEEVPDSTLPNTTQCHQWGTSHWSWNQSRSHSQHGPCLYNVYVYILWAYENVFIIFSSMETHKRMNRSYPSVIHRLQQHNIFEYARCREGSNFHVQ